MKKIFVGNSILFLAAAKDMRIVAAEAVKIKKEILLVPYIDKSGFVNTINRIESSAREEILAIVHPSVKELEKEFFSLHKQIQAAGGAVFNKKGELLMMFRRGKWDLPKGKADKGESARKTALREIQEETGIDRMKIISPVKFLEGRQDCTYHTYELNGKKIIKATYWFKIRSNFRKEPVPQTDEGIETVAWYSLKQVNELLKNSFHSIEEVVSEATK